MKAIIVREYGDVGVLKLEETPMPEVGVSDILVKIVAAGVNPVDTYIRQGNHVSAPPVPFTPGKDGAGIVEAVGEAVTKFAVGERVYLSGTITGTYAEYCLCREDQVHILPPEASFEEGAALFVPYATAFRALFQKARVEKGETVLIHGTSGAVGIAATQWAKSAGLTVYGTAGTEVGLELIKSVGVDFAFNHHTKGYLDEIRRKTADVGVDTILEMLANKNLVNDFSALARFGKIVIIGSRGVLEFEPRLAITIDATLLGMSLFNSSAEDFEQIFIQIEHGIISGVVKPVIGARLPLSEAAEAHRKIIEDNAHGKIVLNV